jgi:phage terminase large subunit
VNEQVFKFDRECFNPSYIPMLSSDGEFEHFYGGAGSGKSRFVAQREIISSFERHKRKTIVVRKVFNTLKDSCYAELKTVIYEWGLEDCFDVSKSPLGIVNNVTGTEFLFKGFDDPEKIKSITGADRVWYEEATESESKDELDQLRLRLRGFDKVQITLSYNPINVYHYLNQEYHEKRDPRHTLHKSTYRDNPKMVNLEAYAEFIESSRLTNPAYYKVYGLGEWGQNTEGLVYPQYQIVPDMPPTQFYGVDFGFNDPTAVGEHAVADNFESTKKDLFTNELVYESHLTSSMLIQRLNDKGVNKRLPMICDNARPEMIEDLRKAGFNAKPCNKYKGSILDGINRVKTFNIKIVAGSKNTIREVQNYSWLEKDGHFHDDEPKDAVNHAMDEIRYASETQNIQPWSQGQRKIR